LKIHQLHRNF